MPTENVVLSDQEKEILKEVQARLGFESMEETMEHLTRERVQKLLVKLAGQELRSKNRHLF